MRARSFVGVVVVLAAVVVSPSRADARQPGEVATDVNVRRGPSENAAIVRDLSAGEPVVAHERRRGFVRITGAARGWIPVDAFTATGSEEEQKRALLGELAAANADAPPEEQTEADLMYDAVRQWRGEPAGSATIDKVLAQSKKVADRNRRTTKEKIKSLFWKDPFSDQPQKVVLVRKEDRDLVDARRARGVTGPSRGDGSSAGRASRGEDTARLRTELAEVRAELADARAELSAARSDARSARAELARLEGRPSRQGDRAEIAAQSDGDDEASAQPVRRARRRAHHVADRAPAFNAAPPRAAEAPILTETIASPPAGSRSNDPRGIIVVPIEAPIPVRVDKKRGSR